MTVSSERRAVSSKKREQNTPGQIERLERLERLKRLELESK